MIPPVPRGTLRCAVRVADSTRTLDQRATMTSPTARAALIVALAALLGGCGLFGGQSTPEPLRVQVDAAERLNPDDHGASLPTLVRVYQLSSPARARTVELTDLLRDPKAALGEDLLSTEELLLQPGQRVEKRLPREKDTRAVLVAAVVRRPVALTWRDVVELTGKKAPALAYTVEEYRLSRR